MTKYLYMSCKVSTLHSPHPSEEKEKETEKKEKLQRIRKVCKIHTRVHQKPRWGKATAGKIEGQIYVRKFLQ